MPQFLYKGTYYFYPVGANPSKEDLERAHQENLAEQEYEKNKTLEDRVRDLEERLSDLERHLDF